MKEFARIGMVGMLVVAMAMTAGAQVSSNGIKGKLDIAFNTRTQLDDSGKPQPKIKDVYTLDLGVTDTLMFKGTVEDQPTLLDKNTGMEKQQGVLSYNLDLWVINPKDASQKKAVGKFTGGVPLDKKGAYLYEKGTMRLAVDAAGTAREFESKFRGVAQGVPPKSESLAEKAKIQMEKVRNQVKGKIIELVVTKYDKMVFQDLVIAAGPVQKYTEAQVGGEMMFDYERSAWYFRGVSVTYTVDGKTVTDKLTGNIKWTEGKLQNGVRDGEYQFDVRVNEPELKGEAAVFKAGDDESAFFTVDPTLCSLTGSAKYKDTIRDEVVTASSITIDQTGNNLSKHQLVYLAKLLWMVCIRPMNAE